MFTLTSHRAFEVVAELQCISLKGCLYFFNRLMYCLIGDLLLENDMFDTTSFSLYLGKDEVMPFKQIQGNVGIFYNIIFEIAETHYFVNEKRTAGIVLIHSNTQDLVAILYSS